MSGPIVPLTPLRRFIAVGGEAMVLLVLGAPTFDGMHRLRVSRGWVAHTQQVVARVDATLSDMQDAETGQRGYRLTGEERYLDPYHRALAALATDTAALRALTRDNPGQQQALDALAPLVGAKIAELEEAITLRRARGAAAAAAVVRTDRGKRAMDTVRAALAGIAADERMLLVSREADEAHHERLATVCSPATLRRRRPSRATWGAPTRNSRSRRSSWSCRRRSWKRPPRPWSSDRRSSSAPGRRPTPRTGPSRSSLPP